MRRRDTETNERFAEVMRFGDGLPERSTLNDIFCNPKDSKGAITVWPITFGAITFGAIILLSSYLDCEYVTLPTAKHQNE